MRFNFNLNQFLEQNDIGRDYLNDFDRVSEFYSVKPDLKLLDKVLSERGRSFFVSRDELCNALCEYNSRIGAGDISLENIEKLRDGETFVVATGQQAGVLTGPEYTVFKAIFAAKLAKTLTNELGRCFVPVFWVASEDSDLSEADNIKIINKNDEFEVGKLDLRRYLGMPIGLLKNVDISEIIYFLEAQTIETEFKASLIETIRMSYSDDRSLSMAFASLMSKLLGSLGIVFIDPIEAHIKKLGRQIFESEILNPKRTPALLREASQKLSAKGYSHIIDLAEDACSFYFYEKGSRSRVYYRDGHFITRYGTHSRESLLGVLADNPELFMTSVSIRPLLQDYVLPTAIYVAGIGEVRYFCQLKKVYESNNVAMPMIYPRSSLTIIEPKIEKILNKYQLELTDFRADIYEMLDRFSGDDKLAAFNEKKNSIIREIADFQDSLAALDKALVDGIDRLKRSVSGYLSKTILKIERALVEQAGYRVSHLSRAKNHLFPRGKTQEMNINIFTYLIKGGPALLDRLYSKIDVKNPEHIVLTFFDKKE
ncbi:MAG: bacillithiol biosynthesis cysteine-adding enzyme BshC [Actinobacteria bacterium]|nr:bacillithiol biosynthesis cysteine-adding enzyme BshC [Actinomycetota bacterium]